MDERIKELIAKHENFQRLAKELPLDFIVDMYINSDHPSNNSRSLGQLLKDNPVDSSLFLSGLVFYLRSMFEQYKKREFTDEQIIAAFTPPLFNMSIPLSAIKDSQFYLHIVKEHKKFYQHIADDYRAKDTNEIIAEAVAYNPLRKIVHPRAKQKELEFYQHISRGLTGTEHPLISWAFARVAPLKDYKLLEDNPLIFGKRIMSLKDYKSLASAPPSYIHLYRQLREVSEIYTTPLTIKDVREAVEIFRLGGDECSGARKATAYAYAFIIGRFLDPATKMWDKIDFGEIAANQSHFSICRDTYRLLKEKLQPQRVHSQ